jgi:hypothetical protein
MSTVVAACAELILPELELVIHEFDRWSDSDDPRFSPTTTSCVLSFHDLPEEWVE